MSPRARALASGLVILGLAVGAGLWRHLTDTPKIVAPPRSIASHPGGPPRPIGPVEFARFMDAAMRTGRGNLAEIQRRAAHAGAVRQVLTDTQRARWAVMMASPRTGERP